MFDVTQFPLVDHSVLDELRALDEGDGSALLRELLEILKVSGREAVRKMSDARLIPELRIINQEAHRLKSSSANLGAIRLSKVCARTEAAAKAGNTAEACALIPELELEFDAAEKELERIILGSGSGSP